MYPPPNAPSSPPVDCLGGLRILLPPFKIPPPYPVFTAAELPVFGGLVLLRYSANPGNLLCCGSSSLVAAADGAAWADNPLAGRTGSDFIQGRDMGAVASLRPVSKRSEVVGTVLP